MEETCTKVYVSSLARRAANCRIFFCLLSISFLYIALLHCEGGKAHYQTEVSTK